MVYDQEAPPACVRAAGVEDLVLGVARPIHVRGVDLPQRRRENPLSSSANSARRYLVHGRPVNHGQRHVYVLRPASHWAARPGRDDCACHRSTSGARPC
jgi:hypothetical protein